jgi:hypothetical protein
LNTFSDLLTLPIATTLSLSPTTGEPQQCSATLLSNDNESSVALLSNGSEPTPLARLRQAAVFGGASPLGRSPAAVNIVTAAVKLHLCFAYSAHTQLL